jgi:protein gp37
MSEKTEIAWCDSTWNPWRGCQKVSPGCKNCYAEKLVNRFGGDFSKRIVAADATFNAPIKWRKKPFVCDECGTAVSQDDVDAFDCPNPKCICHDSVVHPSFHRRRVFLGSLMDIWDPKIKAGTRLRALHIIWQCQELDFLCVTKRPENFKSQLLDCLDAITDGSGNNAEFWQWLVDWVGGKAPENVWAITTTENQEQADKRIPELLKIPAVVHGLSVEPMLGPVDLHNVMWKTQDDHHGNPQPDHYENVLIGGGKFKVPKVDWVIVGGESGPGARPMEIEWLESGVAQCDAAGVKVFVKQDNGPRSGMQGRIPDSLWNRKEFPCP